MNVLVVIDNIFLYDRMRAIIRKKNIDGVMFSFRHSIVKSAIWEHPDFADEAASVIDVAKSTDFIVANFQLVISIHCFQLFSKELLRAVRCINIHPGYNPINRGWYPQVFAIIHDLPIGATIHEIDEHLDHGPIIARSFVKKEIWDTSLSLYDKVLEEEMKLLETNFEAILYNSYQRVAPENEGNLFLKKDFRALCHLDMEKTGSFIDFYNTLRALSHSPYKNAWFTDPVTGKKIFIKLDIEHE